MNMQQMEFKYVGNGFRAWGFSVIFFSALSYVCLKLTGNNLFYLLYLGVPVVANIFIKVKNKNKALSATGKMINSVWIVFGIIAVLMCIGRYFYSFHLFALISILMGIETIVTGIILNQKAIIMLGFVGVFGTIPLMIISGYEQIIIISIIFLFISVIPGLILNTNQEPSEIKKE